VLYSTLCFSLFATEPEKGYQSGLAEPCSVADIMAEVKAEMNGG